MNETFHEWLNNQEIAIGNEAINFNQILAIETTFSEFLRGVKMRKYTLILSNGQMKKCSFVHVAILKSRGWKGFIENVDAKS